MKKTKIGYLRLIDKVYNLYYNILVWFVAIVAQLVEHPHGKGEVAGSIPADGSRLAWVAAFKGR